MTFQGFTHKCSLYRVQNISRDDESSNFVKRTPTFPPIQYRARMLYFLVLHRFEYSPRGLRKRARSRADRNRVSGGPLQFQQLHLFIPHPSRAVEYRFDGGVDRFDDPEPYGMTAVGGDALDMSEEEVPEVFHFRQALPSQRRDPPEQEVQHAGSRLVGPPPIELLAEHIRFEQPAIGREQRLELYALRPARRLQAPCKGVTMT